MKSRFSVAVAAALVALAATGAGCASSSATGAGHLVSDAMPSTLRLGYLVNLTHAAPMVGVAEGDFAKYLGPNTRLQISTFNAGPAEVDALDEGALDAAYMGPSSAITPFEQSHGQALEVISGATSGGADLVVNATITTPSQLKGTTLSSPQLGNTQDVALRYWLKAKGLSADPTGGGDVTILPQSNSAIVTAFASGHIAGAWVPEPYATEMVLDGGHVLVNEASLWPQGRFATTVLVVRKQFAQQYPRAVKDLLQGHVAATRFLTAHPAQAQALVNQQFASLAGKPLNPTVLADAWRNITFTDDPVVSSWTTDAKHAAAVGLGIGALPVTGIFALGSLNAVLVADGQKPVSTMAS
ncbi:MAG: ABC transporter substrate-binding protein [Acidimicrobiales bacterium]